MNGKLLDAVKILGLSFLIASICGLTTIGLWDFLDEDSSSDQEGYSPSIPDSEISEIILFIDIDNNESSNINVSDVKGELQLKGWPVSNNHDDSSSWIRYEAIGGIVGFIYYQGNDTFISYSDRPYLITTSNLDSEFTSVYEHNNWIAQICNITINWTLSDWHVTTHSYYNENSYSTFYDYYRGYPPEWISG